MILVTRTIPFLSGLLTVGLLLILARAQTMLGVLTCLGALALVAVLAVGRLSGWGRDLASWWHIALTPALFVLAVPGLAFFVEAHWLYVVLACAVALFVTLFLEHVFRFVHLPGIYQPYALEHTSLVLHTAAMYFFSVGGFGLLTFLRVHRWSLIIPFFLLSLVLVYEMMWVSKMRDTNAVRIALVGSLLMTELFALLTWLPLSFYVSGACLALSFYLFVGVMRAEQLQKLSGQVLKRYMILGSLLLLLLLVTAQWT